MNGLLLRRVAVARWSRSGASPRYFATGDLDRIRSSIQKLLVNEESLQHEGANGARNATELNASLEHLKSQLNEAAQCVNDCKQNDGEISEAEQALDQAVLCLLDVVETKMQHPTEDYVKKIRELRDELGNLRKSQASDSKKSSVVA